MEAVTKHDFTATADDELSFVKGIKVKILNQEEDKNWYKAEYKGKEGYIPSNYIDLKLPFWYMTQISRGDAENILLEKNESGHYLQRDGAFLVRPCESTQGEFSISVKFANQVQHFKVLRDAGGKYFLWVTKFDSINELVHFHRTSTVSRSQTIYLLDMSRQKVIASYDFNPSDPEELELKRGDIIYVLDKKDPNWWTGEVTRGNKTVRGLFPKSYSSPYTD